MKGVFLMNKDVSNRYDSLISFIDEYKAGHAEIIDHREVVLNKLKRLKNAKRIVWLLMLVSILVKFPKVYNYDFLLNYISLILEVIALFVINSTKAVSEFDLDLTYSLQNFETEIVLDVTKDFLEEEKSRVKVKK